MDILKKFNHQYSESKVIWDENFVTRNSPGHTIEVSELESVHVGTTTAQAYAAGRFSGNIDESRGLAILKELKKLQNVDSADPFFGCFRWYKEESRVKDTNAAFFILEPIVVARMFHSHILSDAEIQVIDEMLLVSVSWFIKECSNPILFYTNKIISDGAMLVSIASVTNDSAAFEIAIDFINKWLEYTENRGYGWGENLSLGYNSVILRAFNVIKRALKADQYIDLVKRFNSLEQKILDIFRFHDGHEFVPTIRSYNVLGKTKPWSLVFNIAEVRGYGFLDGRQEPFGSGTNEAVFRLIVDYMIYGDRLYANDDEYLARKMSNEQKVPRTAEFEIMDNKKSYSWLGKNGGLGSINEFPVIDGSYQHKTWGLGWQCFPVSVITYENQVSFLRFYVNDGERIRCHPHKHKHSAFLDPSLFKEAQYPAVKTSCRQSENTVVAFRSMVGLRNQASEICDSFDIPGFTGNWVQKTVNSRLWTAVLYDKATILISTLLGNPVADENSTKDVKGNTIPTREMVPSVIKNEEGFRLVQTMYAGTLKMHYDDRISAGWLIHFVDKTICEDEIEEYLAEFSVEEECSPDGEIPRMHPFNIHAVKIIRQGTTLIDTRYDPYK